MHEFGTTKVQMAHVTVNNRQHSTLNPYAYFRTPVTIDDVLNSPVVCEPFNLLDCCPENDGSAAVIIASEDLARRYSRHPIWVEGLGMATDTQAMGDKKSLTELLPARLAAGKCYEMAGIGPDELDVVELHDCFSITQIILCEDLGLCGKGEGGPYMEQGHGKIGTKTAINPSGGLMGRGHPLGATGLAQICELFWQLRGEAGERQQPDARVGLQINVGGSAFSTACATILTS